MNVPSTFILLLLLLIAPSLATSSSYDGPVYDYSAYTECKHQAEKPLYNGGILKNQAPNVQPVNAEGRNLAYSPTFVLRNLTQGTIYSFSIWVKIVGADSATVTARLLQENATSDCIGNVMARRGCWSFLKGGFVLSNSSNLSLLYFQYSGERDIKIAITSASLQPFTQLQWTFNQQYKINTNRKRAVTIHVSDRLGARLQSATIKVEQISNDFLFGTAIPKNILGNIRYQNWFVERFNVAVFENELKWYTTEPKQGHLNYTLADKMLEFTRSNQIVVRGHNIFWEDPKYNPAWVRNLTNSELRSAVDSRIHSLMTRYKDDFVHWDVNNEMLHFDFYEQRLGPNASLDFFKTAHNSDPLATVFMNEFNVTETCDDLNSTVDIYISRLKELRKSGVWMDGIGLQGHFMIPNLPLMRAMIDKMATLGLPIWLTEVDIFDTLDKETQAYYLEQVLREGYSHPAVNGITLWSAMNETGSCWQMCLTDTNFRNLPAGDVVDKLLKEWQTGILNSRTDERGSYSFYGYLGEYMVTASFGNKTVTSTFALNLKDETRHFNIQI